jgi:non-homologous end joining protein Ku
VENTSRKKEKMSQKSYVTKFKITLGPIYGVIVDLAGVRKPKTKGSEQDTSLVNVCPDCSLQMHQKYHCENGHGPFLPADVAKARQTPQGLVPLPKEELAALKDDLKAGSLDLKVVPRTELAALTQPSGNIYRIRPCKDVLMPDQFALLAQMARHPELALVGRARLNEGTQVQPFEVIFWNGQPVLRQLIAPSEIAENDGLGEFPVDPPVANMVNQLLQTMATPVDPEMFTSTHAAKLAALVEKHLGNAVQPLAPSPVATGGGGLLSMLAQSLEMAQAALAHPDNADFAEPAPKKRAPRAPRQTRKAS